MGSKCRKINNKATTFVHPPPGGYEELTLMSFAFRLTLNMDMFVGVPFLICIIVVTPSSPEPAAGHADNIFTSPNIFRPQLCVTGTVGCR